MKTILVLIIGAAIGIAAYVYFAGHKSPLERASDKISHGADSVKGKWNDAVGDLDTNRIREELANTGKVIRKKAEQAGTVISDAANDARITTQIKAKIAVESDLSALKISVNTTAGVVTLSGTVSSTESIQKAMQIALSVDGVSEVVSTLQVKSRSGE